MLLAISYVLVLLVIYASPTATFSVSGTGCACRAGRGRLAVLAMEIAPYKMARAQNIPGNLFVDESCIDCDVCRWMCPGSFERKGIKSAVTRQPVTEVSAHADTCPLYSCLKYSTCAVCWRHYTQHTTIIMVQTGGEAASLWSHGRLSRRLHSLEVARPALETSP
jgi:4Fe-4S single cluster domain of Ferredoxin I